MTPNPSAEIISEPTSQIPSTAGMTTKVVKGSMWTLGGSVLPLAVSFVSTPFIIRFLGTEGYGVLILIGLIPIYFSFADFGMGVASTKFASEAYGKNDRHAEASIVRTSALVALGGSVPFAIVIFVFSGAIARMANVPQDAYSDATTALKITSVSFVLGVLASVLNTPLLTRMRMDLNALTYSLPKALMLLATPVVLYFGGGLVGAVWLVIAAGIVIIAGQLFLAKRLLPELFALTINKTMLRPLLKFGAGMMTAVVAVVILQNVEKILLPTLVSVKALAYYSVAFTFANMTSMFASSMVQSLIPAFSQLLEQGKRAHFDSLFVRAIRLNMILLPLAIMWLFVFAKPFFSAWAGPDFGVESTMPFYVLLIGLIFNLIGYIPYSAITSYGRTDIFAKLAWGELLISLLLTYMLISVFGIIGAAVAWTSRMIFEGISLMYISRRLMQMKFDFTRSAGLLLLGLLLVSPAMLLAAWYDKFSLWLIGMSSVFTILYCLWVWRVSLDDEEKRWFRTQILSLAARLSR